MKYFSFLLLSFFSVNCAFAQTGNVGINTSTPQAMLHVKDSSVLFSGATNLPAISGNPPASGAGTRMMWYPDKAAFRAGSVFNEFGNESTYWNKDSIGVYSIALGLNTKAKGYGSIALGYKTIASGFASTALGDEATATSAGSTAFGYGPDAMGIGSTAMGYGSTAMGYGSTATGYLTIASGYASIASGNQTNASGNSATAIGEFSDASGTTSTALGYRTKASGYVSTAMGNSSTASGPNSTAMGSFSSASGIFSTAIGYYVNTKGYASTVLGMFNDSILLTDAPFATATNPLFIIGNGNSDIDRSNALVVLKNGNTGINTSAPKSALHVIRNDSSGGPKNPNAIAILESNQGGYLQFSNTDATESGILAGNFSTSIRSAILFRADSSIQLRAGGNSTKVFIEKTGNVGIGTTIPAALLDVNGPAIIGSNGTALTEVIKVTVSKNVAAVSPNSSVTESFTVANSQLNSTVYISPASSLSDGLLIAYARVSTAGTVEVKFTNTTGATIDPATMNFFITVIR
jgi:Head domain of trimeric autotransporter adhesin